MGFEWMQFLDQDTEVPAAYWAWLESLTAAELENISVIVPMVQSNGVVVSPNRMDSLGRLRPASASCQVKIPIGSWVSAIASGMVMRVRSFGALGSIPEVFWLDSLDHFPLFQINRYAKRNSGETIEQGKPSNRSLVALN
jgi:hypothetical protein